MISAVDLLSSNRDIWNRVGGDRLEQLRQPEVAEEEIMFATVAGGGKNFLHGNRQENPRLNRHAMENSEAFSWEHEKANRAKHRDELYVLCANEGSQHDDEGWVMRRRCKEAADGSMMRAGSKALGQFHSREELERNYSPSTGSVFIVGVC